MSTSKQSVKKQESVKEQVKEQEVPKIELININKKTTTALLQLLVQSPQGESILKTYLDALEKDLGDYIVWGEFKLIKRNNTENPK